MSLIFSLNFATVKTTTCHSALPANLHGQHASTVIKLAVIVVNEIA